MKMKKYVLDLPTVHLFFPETKEIYYNIRYIILCRYLSRRKYCKILYDVVCRGWPHSRRRVLCDMTFTCAPLPWEIHRFGGLNSIVIVYIIICYYNICYIFHYDKCVMCEYSEYLYYVNNKYIFIIYILTTYILLYPHIQYTYIFLCTPHPLSPPP